MQTLIDALAYGPIADRPANPGINKAGMRWFDPDTLTEYGWDGTTWLTIAQIAAGGLKGYCVLSVDDSDIVIDATDTSGMNFDTVVIDVGNFANLGAHDERFTIPDGYAGLYVMAAQLIFEGALDPSKIIFSNRVNFDFPGRWTYSQSGGFDGGQSAVLFSLGWLDDGDTVSIHIRNSDTVSITTHYCSMFLARIGDK